MLAANSVFVEEISLFRPVLHAPSLPLFLYLSLRCFPFPLSHLFSFLSSWSRRGGAPAANQDPRKLSRLPISRCRARNEKKNLRVKGKLGDDQTNVAVIPCLSYIFPRQEIGDIMNAKNKTVLIKFSFNSFKKNMLRLYYKGISAIGLNFY